jgi:hypothetical protein
MIIGAKIEAPSSCFQTGGHCLAMLKIDLGLGPKAKFVVLNSSYKFY